MNRKTALTIFLITLAFSVSFLAVTCTQNSPNFSIVQDIDGSQKLAYSLPLVVTAGLQGNSSILNQPTRLEIYNFIKNNPGVHFRGVCNNMDLPVGVVQYHLGILEQAGLVGVHDDGQLKRYFESKIYTAKEVQLISMLRHETTGKILAALSQSAFVLHKDLARNLSLSPQALSWQMNQLKKTGLIETEKQGITVKYSVSSENAAEIRPLLNVVGKSQM